MILSVDTSLPLLSVAVVRDGGHVASLAVEGRESRNEKLLPAIDWLLGEAGATIHDVKLFAVTRGPGSFTGVRIGLATIQGLAAAVGQAVCAMSTYEAIGSTVPGRVLVRGDAGRGEFYAGGYEEGNEILAPSLHTADALSELRREFATEVAVDTFVARSNVALATAQRASVLREGAGLDRYGDLTPIYVRLAEAEVKLLKQKTNV
jgi:tRNA threonylcarbamoyl adenosine modification protein YeaZ